MRRCFSRHPPHTAAARNTATIHLAFVRPNELLTVTTPDGRLWKSFRAQGDAVGYTTERPYGHNAWMPEGHYVLGDIVRFEQPTSDEGFGTIRIGDMTHDAADVLSQAKRVRWSGALLIVNGIAARIGQLSAHGRSNLKLHGGGSNAPEPLHDFQLLCKAKGSTRMHNADYKELVTFLTPLRASNTLVFSAVGDPVALPC